MKVVVLGCGRLGAQIASLLYYDGHQVNVIDKDAQSFERLPEGFDGKKVVGLGFDRSVLIEAEIEHADAFVAVARGDNHNAVSAYVARNVFGVPRVVARIYNQERAKIYWSMGIMTVAPVTWAANEIKDILLHREIEACQSFGNGEIKMFILDAKESLVGKKVSEIEDPGHLRIVCFVRNESSFIPATNALIEAGDRIVIAADSYGREKIDEFLRGG